MYEDKLDGKISTDMWDRKSQEWQNELLAIQAEIERYRKANVNYYADGLKILELAQMAYDLYLRQSVDEQRKPLDTLLLNCTFNRGTISPTYRKPFDILVQNHEKTNWRPQGDLNPCCRLERAVS